MNKKNGNSSVWKWLAISAVIVTPACANSEAPEGSQSSATVATTAPEYPADIKDPCYSANKCYSAPVGSGLVEGKRLTPFHAKWDVYSITDGERNSGGSTFEERLERASSGNWRHMQIARPGDGTSNTGYRELHRDTVQVLSARIEFENMPDDHPISLDYDLSGTEFSAQVKMRNGTEITGGAEILPIPMYDGQIAGIALSALQLKQGLVHTLPFVIAHTKSKYWVEATVAGKTVINSAGGDAIPVWEVDTKWVDLGSGSVSEGGADKSGGAYYIAVTPGNGVPPVVEYINSGVAVVWDGARR